MTPRESQQNCRLTMNSSLFIFCLLFPLTAVIATDLSQPSSLIAVSSPPTFVVSSSPPPGFGLPVFVVEPDDINYVVRGGRPVILTCGAWPAIQITVQCAGQWIDPSRQVTGEMVDPRTGSRYLRTTVELSKDEIEQLTASQSAGGPVAAAGSAGGGGSQMGGDGDYQCECHAWNNVPTFQSARSKKIYIRLAYLRKRFEQEPINTVAELSSNVQLQCHPPSGLPIPEVFWLKDGELIDVHTDTNFIISNEGSLIINQARLSDSGNYSCGSQNMAGRRISESATLTVRVTGVWSPWSDWSECSAICSRGFQRRSRSCLYPSSSSVGRLDTDLPMATQAHHQGGPQQQVSVNVVPCQGDANQRTPCASLCAVDGDWSVWSAWSSCGTDCRRYRRRVCDNPLPEHGGKHCQGLDLDTTSCVGTMDASRCPDTGAVDVTRGSQLLVGTADDDVFKYVGLALGCAVFVAAIGLVACFLRRFRPHHCQDAESKQSNALRQGLMIPDLTKTVIVVGDCSSTKNSGAESPTQHDVTYDHVGDAPDMMSRWLPSNGDISAVAWSKIGHGGACLCLPELDVSLTIPEGSIVDRQHSEVFLTTSTADNNRPSLSDDQTLLCGVVICGPASLRLEKPAVLTFPHCASDVNNQWSWSVLYSDVTSGEQSTWRLLDHAKPVPDICLQIEPDHCCIMTRMLGRYMLVGQPIVARTTLCPSVAVSAAKILRLAVFVPRVPASLDFNVRVYFVEDTPDALEGVLRVENQLGGSLIDKSRTIPFYLNGGNLHLAVEEVGPGWWLKQVNGYQEIPFRHIWNGTQSGLHCSFALEHVDAAAVGLDRWNRLNCDIVVCQTSLPNHRQLIQISHDVTYSMTQQTATTLHYSGLQDDSCQSRYVFVNQPRLLHARLSQSTRKLLTDALSRPNSQGLDWHALAQQIGFSKHINYFSTTSNPTDRVIDLWESLRCDSRSPSQRAADLVSALRALGHGDLASCVHTRLSRPISTWS